MWRTIFLAFLALQARTTNGDIMIEDPPSSSTCRPFRKVLENAFLEIAALYFADNPRGNDSAIVPDHLDPLTPQNLFLQYYGEGASLENFQSVLTRMVYSDPGNGGKTKDESASVVNADRIVLRNEIYTFVKTGSYDLARERYGEFLYKGVSDFLPASSDWKKWRCVDNSKLEQIRSSFYREFVKLRNEVGEFSFGHFLGLGSGTTLAFAIDDTGSMSGEIAAAKRRAFKIIEERQGSLDQPQDFVLVPFNDPGVGPLTVTTDPDQFKRAINKLYAHGGGDSAELSMRGIQLAVENSHPGSSIFVITDADAKDIELQDNVVAQAKHKNIKITFLLTNKMSPTVCGSYDRNSNRCKNRSLKKGYELYQYLASSTGGKIMVVSRDSIFQATEVIERTLKQGVVDLVRSVFSETSGEKAFVNFYVDSASSDLFLQLSGSCINATITRPNGLIALQEDKVEADELSETRVSINDIYGEYVLSVIANGNCEIKISTRSVKGFIKTLTRQVVDEKTGDVTYERFEGQPLTNYKVTVLIDEYGRQYGDRSEAIEIVNKADGKVLQTIKIDNPEKGSYSIPIKSRSIRAMMIILKGTDRNGNKFQRIASSDLEFVSLDFDCSVFNDIVFRAGDNVTVDIPLKNHGNIKKKYSLEATDDKSFVERQDPVQVEIDQEETISFPVRLIAPKTTPTGTVSTLTVTAKIGWNLVFKQCRVIVGQRETPDIESFDIVSKINSRFVETAVTSTVYNNATVGREATFHVIMPVDAFITEFSMTIDNVTYPGEIKEKEVAKKLYERAKARGLTAGHVSAREESTRVFTTSTNLEAEKRVVFNLKYQQLLIRSRGRYRHEIIVQTKQPVGRLSIDVHICESRPLTPVSVLGFNTEQTVQGGFLTIPGVTIDQQIYTAHVSFKPTREEQLKISPLGLNGKFVLEYDVTRKGDSKENEVIASDKHFVHFFSPELEPISKRVVFLLDNSASMSGRKINQVRSAMNKILDDLNSDDHFAIIMFNSNVTTWLPGDSDIIMTTSSATSKSAAKEFLKNVTTEGGTNIEMALKEAISTMRKFNESNEKTQHPSSDYIVLLTDGRPTEGQVTPTDLVDFIDRENNQTYGIHTIGFGTLVDAKTLAKIAARNKGSSIQIFEDIDADLQISDFFETISRPMLRDIQITYNEKQVEDKINITFPVIYYGNELLVTGRLSDDYVLTDRTRVRRSSVLLGFFDVSIRGKGKDDSDFDIFTKVKPTLPSEECVDEFKVENFTERLDIYMDLKHTLKEIAAENNETIKDSLKEKALNQSLEYGFVTPGITSMIVLKPDDKKALEDSLKAEEVEKEREEAERKEREAEEADASTIVDESFSALAGATRILRKPSSPSVEFVDRGIGPDIFGLGRGEALDLGIFPTTTRRPLSRIIGGTRPPSPSPGSGGKVGFFGDPHFVVDIGDQITVCFNWKGKDGQIFNLLHDERNGITVNGKIVKQKNVTDVGGHEKTYVNELGITSNGIKILVTCEEVIITDIEGKTKSLSMTVNRETYLADVVIKVTKFTVGTSEIDITIGKNKQFKIIKRSTKTHLNILDHLDFAITDSSGFSSPLFGVLGQFSRESGRHKTEALLEFSREDKNKAVLWYHNRLVTVRRRQLVETSKVPEIECWFMSGHNDLLDRGKVRYLLSDLFGKPDLGKSHTTTVKRGE